MGTVFVNVFGALTTIAMMMVSRAHQRRGIAARLLDRALAGTEDRVVMLFATAEGRPLYEKLGFVANGVCVRVEGVAKDVAAAESCGVRPATEADVTDMCAVDEDAQGGPRHRLIESFLGEGGNAVVAEERGEVRGFGISRVIDGVRVIAPLVARSDAQGVALAAALAKSGEEPVRIDLEPGERAVTGWAEAAGLAVKSAAPRMVRHGRKLPGRRIFIRALASRGYG